MEKRTCRKCLERKPLTTQYFNLLSTGYWRGSCKICMAANTKRLYDADPQKVIDRVANYKEQKSNAIGSYDASDVSYIRNKVGDLCFYCGVPLRGGGEVDHMTPVSRNGSNLRTNLTLACRTCNRDKHNKTAAEFFAWRRRLGLSVREDTASTSNSRSGGRGKARR